MQCFPSQCPISSVCNTLVIICLLPTCNVISKFTSIPRTLCRFLNLAKPRYEPWNESFRHGEEEMMNRDVSIKIITQATLPPEFGQNDAAYHSDDEENDRKCRPSHSLFHPVKNVIISCVVERQFSQGIATQQHRVTARYVSGRWRSQEYVLVGVDAAPRENMLTGISGCLWRSGQQETDDVESVKQDVDQVR
ncbi:hypothetical protein Btru_054221 [Bulinus truncatus]|nr:hypothetical protein Btru_054221 [Bulinus truncatus]